MQIPSQKIQPGRSGYALTITLIFLAVSLTIFGSIFLWTSTNAKITLRNNQFNMSQAAAEAAVERVIAQIDRDFIAQSISNSSAYVALPANISQSSWPVQYTYSATNGTTNQISVAFGAVPTATVPLSSQYAGLYGLAQDCTITATATPRGQSHNVPATVQESLQFATIPLYQFAIFYNVNLEISPGQPMNITGPVFCNQSIWEGSVNASFSDTVSAVGTNCTTADNPFASSYTGSTGATFNKAGQPVNNVNPLIMPIGTNNDPATILGLLKIPPPEFAMGTSAAYTSNGMVYPANAADLVITNIPTGTNFGVGRPFGTNTLVYFQDSSLLWATNDFYIMTNRGGGTVYYTNDVPLTLKSNIVYAGYSFVTNVAFGDWREGWNGGAGVKAKTVQALQIDVAKLKIWITNTSATGGKAYNDNKVTHSGHNISSIYAYNSVPLTATTLPAVRVINGTQLPTISGLTVATPFPIYVKGDYNVTDGSGSSYAMGDTTNTLPAALMADAITILSGNWNDTTATKLPLPANTTVNAAMLEGIVASDPTISGDYSGGVENFLRLLENWGGTLTYNGSIVVLFYSQYATNHWDNPGGYYGAPTRKWAFDTNFRDPTKLPPLTPSIKAMVRGQWNAN